MNAKPLVAARRFVVVVIAMVGGFVFSANTDVVQAGIGASGVPSFPSVVKVGQIGLPAFVRVANQNTDPDDIGVTNTVCNFGDAAPCPTNDPGISLTPSCGILAAFSACAGTPANAGDPPSGADPNVLRISPTGTGTVGTACAGMAFKIETVDVAKGQLRITPTTPGLHVQLKGFGTYCQIDFTFDVLRVPTIDHDMNKPGVQTVQIADDTQDDGNTSGSGRGTFQGMTVNPATPAIATASSVGVGVSGQITDRATITGRVSPVPGATVTFKAYGPNDATCGSAAAFSSTVPVDEAAGTATSAAFTPSIAGVYRWTASYSGDANNANAVDGCNAANETVTVVSATPTIITTASGTVPITIGITDTAAVSGRVNPIVGATVTFNLYGPNDANCTAAAVFTSTKPVDVNGSATSNPYAATVAGVYRWVGTYNGDANNVAVTEPCNSIDESVTITDKPGVPTLATLASGTVGIGGALFDQATVSGRHDQIAGATVTFRLYGPNDTTCATTPLFTVTVPVDANGSAASGNFAPPTAGTYRWIATYNGDVNNATVAGVCGESSETTLVTSAAPTIITVATVNTAIGGVVSDTAQVSGRVNPVAGATVSFSLYGPDDATCSRPPIFASTVALNADGTATSASFSPNIVGTYRWIAGFSGDVNNVAVAASCNAANEAVALLGPDLQQSLPATGARTSVPLAVGTLFVISGGLLLLGVRRRTLVLLTRR